VHTLTFFHKHLLVVFEISLSVQCSSGFCSQRKRFSTPNNRFNSNVVNGWFPKWRDFC